MMRIDIKKQEACPCSKRAGMSWFMVGKILVLSVCLAAMTEGCSRQTQMSAVYKKLRPLTDAFGVPWPTNCISQNLGSWNFYAPLDAGSRNNRIVARLEIDAPTFSAWRRSATNRMREHKEFVVPFDENLTRKFAWWNPHLFNGPNMSAFVGKLKDQSRLGELWVFSFKTNDVYLLYIQGRMSKH